MSGMIKSWPFFPIADWVRDNPTSFLDLGKTLQHYNKMLEIIYDGRICNLTSKNHFFCKTYLNITTLNLMSWNICHFILCWTLEPLTNLCWSFEKPLMNLWWTFDEPSMNLRWTFDKPWMNLCVLSIWFCVVSFLFYFVFLYYLYKHRSGES